MILLSTDDALSKLTPHAKVKTRVRSSTSNLAWATDNTECIYTEIPVAFMV